MKLIVIFSLAICLNASATGFGQTVTLSESSASLETIFSKIKKQTGYTFACTKAQLKKSKPITISISDASLKQVLDICFHDQPLDYTIISETIVVVNRKEKVAESVQSSIPLPAVQIQGKVSNEKGEPLAGANIVEKGTNNATISGQDGSFGLTVSNSKSVLIISYVGYVTKEAPVGDEKNFSISLALVNSKLNEIIVVGYGGQKRGNITGSVSVISSEEMESRPNTQFGNLIQGKAAGVQVLSSSGKPSEGFSIRIRGTSSINSSSEPLYVVDGVPASDTRSLNPSDIESISVLKDASSAAIYGAQGANGVVLITTKKGKTGKPKIEFNSYAGSSSVQKKLDVLNADQYKALMTEIGQNTDWSLYTANTNWQDKIFQQGRSQNYQLSLSGRNEKTGYYISGGWVQQVGAVRSAEMDRANFKVNLDQKVNDWLKVGTNLAYTRYHDVAINDNQQVNRGGVLLGALNTPPVIDVYNADGTFTRNPFQDWENPIASTDGVDQTFVTQRILGNMFSEISFIPELKWRTNIGIDYGNSTYSGFRDPFRTGEGRSNGGIGKYTTGLSNYWIAENTLSYTKTIQQHNFSALAAVVFQKNNWEKSEIERRGFTGSAVITPNGGSTVSTAFAEKWAKANQSYLSRITYDYSGKYLLTANFRADNSSAFGPGNRWGYFPSFSAGWRVSKENFFQAGFINDLKIRAGWGIVGNDQIGSYAYLATVGVTASYPIGGVILPGTYPSSIGNSDLKWEQTQQTNLALDLSMLQSRVNFTAEIYNKKTTDLLLSVPIPNSTGLSSGIQNVGSVQNKGIEFSLNTKNLVNKFQWETDFNISFNRNKVVNVVGQQISGGGIINGDIALNKAGYPLGMFYGYVADVVDPKTGDLFYLDSKGNSTFNPNPATDRVFIGNPNPDFIYGLTNTFSFKNLSISVFLQGTQGNDVFNASRIDNEAMEGPKNQSAVVLRRWMKTGDITDIPRSGNTNNARISTRFVEDGSYLRVRTATLAYSLPQSILSKVKISAAKLYVTGENLFILTGYSGFDPEVNFQGGSNTVQGIDYGTYPHSRNLIFGLSISL
ncbi:MAG: TonB-dependent receptor [Ferruginibacter sp.]